MVRDLACGAQIQEALGVPGVRVRVSVHSLWVWGLWRSGSVIIRG